MASRKAFLSRNIEDSVIFNPLHDDVLTYYAASGVWINKPASTLFADLYLTDQESDIGDYHKLLSDPAGGSEMENQVNVAVASGLMLIKAFATDDEVNTIILRGGSWHFVTWAKVDNIGGDTDIVVKTYTRTAGGSETLIATVIEDVNSTELTEIEVDIFVPDTIVNEDDRIVVKYYAQTTSNPTRVVTMTHDGVEHYTHMHLPFGIGSAGGVSTFTGLTDTPADYSGEGGKLVAVNDGENALEFVPSGVYPTTFLGLSDTPADYSGQDGKVPTVNAGENALEFTALPAADNFKVKVSSDDNTENYLENKLVAGTNITLTVQNPAGNEDILIDVDTLDHGELDGLGDDDHTQYLLANGTRIVSGDFTVGAGDAAYSIVIDGAATFDRLLVFRTNSVDRWRISAEGTAEGGSDTGSDFEILARKDDGSALHTALKIIRSTGNVEMLGGGLSVGLAPPYTQPKGHLFIHDGSANDYGFIESEGSLILSTNSYFDGAIWRVIKTGKSATLYMDIDAGLLLTTDTTSRTAGNETTRTVKMQVDMDGNITAAGGLTTTGLIKGAGGIASGNLAPGANDIWATTDIRVGGGLYVGAINVNPAPGDIRNTGDIYTVPWTDYSGTSTVVGWNTLENANKIMYKRIGKTCFIKAELDGTSGGVDGTVATFTLPYQAANDGAHMEVAFRSYNNGSYDANAATCQLLNNAQIASCIRQAGAWTAAGRKIVRVSFRYEVA